MLGLQVVCILASLWVVSAGNVIQISQGVLRGVVHKTRGGREIQAFLGIPYAQPPMGHLRFQAPQPAQPWEGERDCSSPSNPCLQANSSARGEIIGSEDCLYLNVYLHKISYESLKPVLVFIHGGDFQEGWSQHYQPDFLMDKDIVLVTMNYRLGVLGFLSLEDVELPGNNGLKDQSMALKWVQENIAQFGGNPAQVTLWGEGAGAASAHLHMLSAESSGLFQRAISQSGSAYCPWAVHSEGQAQVMGERFAAHLGCNHHLTNQTLDCLQAIPAYVLVDIAQGMYEWHTDPLVLFGPAIEPANTEGIFLSKDPWQSTSNIPWIVGLNSVEGTAKALSFDSEKLAILNDDFEFHGPLTLLFRETAEDTIRTALSVKKFYFLDGDIKHDDIEGLSNMYSDAWFMHPIKQALRMHQGSKYLYYIDILHKDSFAFNNSQGGSHFDDNHYFFPMTGLNKYEVDRDISAKLIDMWTNFIINGEPTLNASEIVWEQAATATEYLHISTNGFTMGKHLLQERDNFWSGLDFRNKQLTSKRQTDKDEL